MKALLLFALCLMALPTFSQTSDEKAVHSTITQLFDGMRKADTTLFKATLLASASLQSVARSQDGQVTVRQESIPAFVASVGKQKAGALDERLAPYEVKIDGDLATAWTPYVFYFNNQKSHCGVNAFTLVRVNGQWKIQAIIDTRRRDNCPDLPKP